MSQQEEQNNNSSVPEELKNLLQKIIGTKQTIITSSMVKIFTTNSNKEWIYTNILGILTLIWDRERNNTPFLRLFEIESFNILFEFELYIDFNIISSPETPSFSYFQFMHAYIGFQFTNQYECNTFNIKVNSLAIKSQDIEINSDNVNNSNINNNEKNNNKNNNDNSKKQGMFGFRQKAKQLFGSIFKKNNNKQDENEIENCQISNPISLKKEQSLQFDHKTNSFDYSKLDDNWKSLFLSAGIQQEHLTNNKIAPIIFDSVNSFQSYYAQQQQNQNNNNNISSQQQQSQKQYSQRYSQEQYSVNSLNQDNNISKSFSFTTSRNSQSSDGMNRNTYLQNQMIDLSQFNYEDQQRLSNYLSQYIQERKVLLN